MPFCRRQDVGKDPSQQHCRRLGCSPSAPVQSRCAEQVFGGLTFFFCKWARAGGWAWLRIWLQFLGLHTQPQTCRIFPKTWPAGLAPPSPQNVVASSGARRWQLCFFAFPAFNYTAAISKQDVFWSDPKCLFCWSKNESAACGMHGISHISFSTHCQVTWYSNRYCHKSGKSDALQAN